MRSPVAVVVLALAWSCTSNLDTFGIGAPDGGPAGGAGVASASSGAGASTAGTGGSSSSAMSAGGGGAAVASSASSSAEASSAESASSAEASSAASTGAGGSGGGAIVPCGPVTCNPGQVCCFDAGNMVQIGCALPGGCGGLAELACDGPSDCGGEVCCGTWTGTTWTDMSCQATCNNSDERIMCGGDASMCSTACLESGAASDYYWCT